jgi:hypothetical protein
MYNPLLGHFLGYIYRIGDFGLRRMCPLQTPLPDHRLTIDDYFLLSVCPWLTSLHRPGLFGRSSLFCYSFRTLVIRPILGFCISYSLTASHVLKGPVVRISDRALLARAHVTCGVQGPPENAFLSSLLAPDIE